MVILDFVNTLYINLALIHVPSFIYSQTYLLNIKNLKKVIDLIILSSRNSSCNYASGVF